ncbi:MAG: Crossover junction endodeoxyribonuclease RuvC [Candidatus Omnitrophica bacterium]|nr:Crossover junction endodeoxyribonuclease RuvC [Candidatus Omnitrophota bacterium]
MRILGVDPGLRVTGYAVLTAGPGPLPRLELLEAGVIRTDAGAGIASRLKTLHDALEQIVREHRPETLAIEKLFAHSEHPTTAILMAHARGVVCLVSGLSGVPLVSLPSTHVKKAVTGRGHATKAQIQRTVQQRLGLRAAPEPADVSDAIAIAMACAMNPRLAAPRARRLVAA